MNEETREIFLHLTECIEKLESQINDAIHRGTISSIDECASQLIKIKYLLGLQNDS